MWNLLREKYLFQRLKFWLYDKRYIFYTPLNKVIFFINGVTFGCGLRVYGFVFVKNLRGKAYIGDNVTINSAGWANPIGCGEKTYIQVFEGGELKIGSNVGISNAAITCTDKVNIGDNVLIGAGACIFDTDFHSKDEEVRSDWRTKGQKNVSTHPVNIGTGAFIGARCMILKGSTIESGSIVGAGSVVAGQKLEKGIWGGNPVKRIN